ncbi:MAG TPA: anti-sigma factor [Candidatus Corynebacterium avicola]|uniref:Anti-sigma factor n=1 Tax=Candidatus Corynebacterium avicola TaxID=2838527 RepID=A0A9D1RNU3_9CORY|nr:anti-sigma factor [Candidatus Corynebacterium avicola]
MTDTGAFSAVGHLTPEVVAALVDGELSRGAEQRAKVHLVHCQECRGEVRAQRQAAERLRDSDPLGDVHISGSLLARLTQIPAVCEESGQVAAEDAGNGSGPATSGDIFSDEVGPDGCRRPNTLSGRMAAAMRRAQRRGGATQPNSPRYRRGR